MLLALAVSHRLLREDPAVWRPHVLDNVEKVSQRGRAAGPLKHGTANSPYFTDGNGKAVYLTGSHVWNNLQEIEPPLKMDDHGGWIEPGNEPVVEFNFSDYLRFLARENHNFIRLWSWEEPEWLSWLNSKIAIYPSPYARTGPGVALDGLPKFNVQEFNQSYFDRLRNRVSAAGDRGIYVSVMLFQGWSIDSKGMSGKNPWQSHPFNRANNVNGINGDPNGDSEGVEIHTLQIPEVTALQESYVRKVVTTLNDFDNVLYEITNESPPASKDWQYHMINFIKHCEADQPKQHPVGMTACFPSSENAELFASPADWISPNCTAKEDYCKNPPAAHGNKVVISDTDHLCGVGCDRSWVWKSFARGLNPIFMDPIWMPEWESTRKAMGMTLAYANRMNLSTMRPRGDLASSGYCLADPDNEYLVYLPFEAHKLESTPIIRRFRHQISNFRRLFNQTVTIDLSNASGKFLVEWCDPSSGEITKGTAVRAGTKRSLTAPFEGDAVLYMLKQAGG